MSDMTAAEELRAAAKLMRERAEAATPSPWEASDNEDHWQLFGNANGWTHPLQLIKAPKHGTPYAEYWPNEADSAHIVSWHPEVAKVVAKWLDAEAERAEAPGALALHSLSPGPLAVARAYLAVSE